MPGDSVLPRSPFEYVVSLLVHPGRRILVLIVIAYVSGVGGIVLSVLGNPADPRSVYGVAGIVLMGLSFCCMFAVSVTMAHLAGGE